MHSGNIVRTIAWSTSRWLVHSRIESTALLT